MRHKIAKLMTRGRAVSQPMTRRPVALRLGQASLFATPEGRLDFFKGREIFLESVDMLLHLADGQSEFLHRAECPTQLGHLRLRRLLAHRPQHEPEHKHPTEQTHKYPPPESILVHTILLSVAAAPVVSPDRRPITPDLAAFHQSCLIVGRVLAQSKAFSHYHRAPRRLSWGYILS